VHIYVWREIARIAGEMSNLQRLIVEFDYVDHLDPSSLDKLTSTFPNLATITPIRRNHPHTFCANKGSAPVHDLLRLKDCGRSPCTAKRRVADAQS
jgi:hypothetical protein